MKRKCTLCGGTTYEMLKFKSGNICEKCLDYIKSDPTEDCCLSRKTR